MNTQLITDWINSTKQHDNPEKKEYHTFIQLYFLLNYIFKEIHNNAGYSDTETMTKAFPEIINEKWDSIKKSDLDAIKNDIKTIHLLMARLIDLLILKGFSSIKSDNPLFTELIPIGYYVDNEYYQKKITKDEIDHYNTILMFCKIKKDETVEFLKATLTILYAIRNSYYHGGKDEVPGQLGILFYLNYVMIEILKISPLIQSELYNTNIESEINTIEQSYKEQLVSQLKIDLIKKVWSNYGDFSKWRKLSNSGNDYFYFAYNFILIEKTNNIIIRVLHNKKDDNKKNEIIDSIKKIETYFDIQFIDDSQKDINYYETEYKDLKKERNNFFHGNNHTQLDINKIKELNIRLEEFINQIQKWLKNAIDYHDRVDYSMYFNYNN